MSQPLFGLVPAGQPVITTPTSQPSPTSCLFAIPQSPPGSKPFSHIVVFLLPGITLPENCAAAIYLVTPGPSGSDADMTTRFLGGIGPGKESAIFNVGAAASTTSSRSNVVVIGVSLEPAESVAQRVLEKTQSAASSGGSGSGTGTGSGALVPARQQQQQQPSTLVLAQRIIKNAFNFLASFSGQAGQVEVVPLKAFEEWWRKFESRVRSDPGFLERDD
ncbi:hypothetical protein GE09DRAFT_624557 [Coniochaeta sp. 2T2.1]|nr:hypothetical protein GE09DRAFT_624557 [Coniochaeta sp. 2T2.1]